MSEDSANNGVVSRAQLNSALARDVKAFKARDARKELLDLLEETASARSKSSRTGRGTRPGPRSGISITKFLDVFEARSLGGKRDSFSDDCSDDNSFDSDGGFGYEEDDHRHERARWGSQQSGRAGKRRDTTSMSPLERARLCLLRFAGSRSAADFRRHFAKFARQESDRDDKKVLGVHGKAWPEKRSPCISHRGFREALEAWASSERDVAEGYPLDQDESARLIERFSSTSGDGKVWVNYPSVVDFVFGKSSRSGKSRRRNHVFAAPDPGSDVSIALERVRSSLCALGGDGASRSRTGRVVDLAAVFHKADVNGDGELSQSDFESALAKLGELLDRAELDAVMRYFDRDGR